MNEEKDSNTVIKTEENDFTYSKAKELLVSITPLNVLLEAAVNNGFGYHIFNKVYDLMGFNELDFGLLKFELNFDGFPPMKFVFRRQLSKEKSENRKTWLGMTDEEADSNIYEYNVRVLAELLEVEPLNIPSYPQVESGSMKNRFITHFLKYENRALFNFINTAFNQKQYPKELS